MHFMTGTIIDFRVHHQLKSGCFDYQEPAPRGRAKRRRPAGRASLNQQIAHVAWLVRELEEIARSGERLPQVLVADALASIERSRKMLQSLPDTRTSGRTDATGEDAAQPDIDHALLERMYGELGLSP